MYPRLSEIVNFESLRMAVGASVLSGDNVNQDECGALRRLVAAVLDLRAIESSELLHEASKLRRSDAAKNTAALGTYLAERVATKEATT